MGKFKRIIERRLLQERQILFSNGADYNQAVFLAGGAGSGKGFAQKHFMQGEKFKSFDVDRWKEGYLELAKETDRYPQLQDLDLSNPEDVSKLHRFVKDKGIHNKFVNNVLMNSSARRKPNVMFDVTLDDISKLNTFLPMLKEAGYKPQNIHLVWILTDYEIAVKRNRSRERIVPEDILMQTHEGAAETVTGLVDRGLPRGMDGSVRVILNNPTHTVVHTDENGNPIESTGEPVDLPGGLEQTRDYESEVTIKDFQYLTLKEKGKPFRSPIDVKETLAQWIRRNAPKTVKTWKAISTIED